MTTAWCGEEPGLAPPRRELAGMVENDESLLERADSMQVSSKATSTAVKTINYCEGELTPKVRCKHALLQSVVFPLHLSAL